MSERVDRPVRPARSTRLLAAALSLVGSLVIAELGARALHRSAYPYLNLFVADPLYGVRLEPSARTRVRSRLGGVTEVATNALGFRGPEWPTPVAVEPGAVSNTSAQTVPGRVLLLGDSQVMGFGVPWSDTFAARLGERGFEVLTAAVPSWGPTESLRALEELAPRYRPRLVVFVANAANDWMELGSTNVERTTARDGWAARVSPGEPAPRRFPGRDFLLGRSHLVLAARELLEAGSSARELPSATAAQILLREATRSTDGTTPSPSLRSSRSPRSSMTRPLMAAVAACRRLGCQVVAVALPLDLQVDAREWRKYREAPIDLRATERLLEDFVADARDAGVPSLNLLPVLRAAEPGAFLLDDYHLSSRGHAAVARALAALLTDGDGGASTVALAGTSR